MIKNILWRIMHLDGSTVALLVFGSFYAFGFSSLFIGDYLDAKKPEAPPTIVPAKPPPCGDHRCWKRVPVPIVKPLDTER